MRCSNRASQRLERDTTAVIVMCPKSLLGISLHGDARGFFPRRNGVSIVAGYFLPHQDLLYILTSLQSFCLSILLWIVELIFIEMLMRW